MNQLSTLLFGIALVACGATHPDGTKPAEMTGGASSQGGQPSGQGGTTSSTAGSTNAGTTNGGTAGKAPSTGGEAGMTSSGGEASGGSPAAGASNEGGAGTGDGGANPGGSPTAEADAVCDVELADPRLFHGRFIGEKFNASNGKTVRARMYLRMSHADGQCTAKAEATVQDGAFDILLHSKSDGAVYPTYSVWVDDNDNGRCDEEDFGRSVVGVIGGATPLSFRYSPDDSDPINDPCLPWKDE